MPDDIGPPPIRRITRVRPLERTLLSAALMGGAAGLCIVCGLVALVGLAGSNRTTVTLPTAIVVTVTPSPIPPTPTEPPPLPTATAPAALFVGGYAQVSGTEGDALRLRSDPGLQTTTLKTIAEGAKLLILDGPRDAADIIWWRLRDPSDGAEGWAAQLYLIPASAP
jgi:hypothetical protein